jgi:molybdopterin-containing oxidoreductase family iron-sulfur binding subunit
VPTPDDPRPNLDADAGVEVVFRPDPSTWDGRFANCAWLQELPKPLTKLTWDNIAALAPGLAERLGVRSGELLEINTNGGRVVAPAWILPGQAERSVTIFLGYGRRRAGRVGDNPGYDAYRLRPAEAPWTLGGVRVAKLDKAVELATTQTHNTTEGHDIVRVATEQQARAGEGPEQPAQPSLYRPPPPDEHAWGMVIDLDLCIGCNACVLACQSENNVPSVGKRQVRLGREMHWLRVDRYYAGPAENPETYFMPVPCMHCEKAPCELGCPVNATVHGNGGLNEMVYNRCIGTRTCSSYCPYKVRRFNWFDYTRDAAPAIQAQRNPNVTVRDRGVMEKCTFCIQRIAKAKIDADVDNRSIRDGEVVPACQAACPTTAIMFGDLNDPDARVSRWKRTSRNYALLEHLGTRPRTTYLARVKDDIGRTES